MAAITTGTAIALSSGGGDRAADEPLTCFGKPPTILGTDANDGALKGTDGADVIIAAQGADNVQAGGGKDLICLRGEGDTTDAGPGNDRVRGGGGADIIFGGDGNDKIQGGRDDDEIFGEAGNDNIDGRRGDDGCTGGAGHNKLKHCETRAVGDNNAPPVAVDDTGSTDRASATTLMVLTNDTDPDGDPLAIGSISTAGTQGTATANPDGTITYDPSGHFGSLHHGQSAHDSFTYTATDGAASSAPATVDVTVTGLNDAPVAVGDTGSTDEVSSKKLAVLANDTDADGDTLAVGSVSNAGTQGTATANPDGTITYDPSGHFKLLRPGQSTHDSFTYTATDGTASSAPATVDVTINGVNDAPVLTDIETTTLGYVDGTPGTPITTTLNLSDPDDSNLESATVAIASGYDNGHDQLDFTNQLGISGTFDSGTGVLTLTGSAPLADYRTALRSVKFASTGASSGTRSIEFSVSDGNVQSNTQTRSVFADRAPTDIALSPASVDENQLSGTDVGDLSTSDPDAGDTFTYALVTGAGDADNGSFSIAGNKLKTAASFDFETKPSYTVRVRTDDGHGGTFAKQLTVAINDVNDAPTDIALSSSSIAENSSAGATIGNLSTTDQDAGATHTYSLVPGAGSADNGSFSITGSALNTGASFDFESKSTYSVRVRTDDGHGGTFEKQFTIQVTDVDDTPTDIALSNNSVDENTPQGTDVGNLSTTDQDTADSFTYSLVAGVGDTHNNDFQITGPTLEVKNPLNFEAGTTRSVRIKTDDGHGGTFEKQFTINVIDVNDAPTNISLSNATTFEHQAVGTTIGDFSTTDEDAGQTFTYSFATGNGVNDADNGKFQISGAHLKNAQDLAQGTYSILVRSTDSGSPAESFDKQFTITVTPPDVAPDLDLDAANGSSDSTASFIEDGGPVSIAPNGTTITDPDDTDMESATATLTTRPDGNSVESLSATIPGGSGISIVGGSYDQSTGTLTFTGTSSKANYALALGSITYSNSSDTPSTADRSVTVKVNDGQLDSTSRTATVHVTAHNDAPVNTLPGTQSTDEDTSKTLSGADAISVSDPDAGSGSLTVTLAVSHGTLALATTAGLTVTGDGTAAVILSGTRAQINTALDGLTYAPDADFNGSESLQITTDDNGNTGAGGAMSDTDSLAITVNPVNDAPVLTVPAGQTVDEDTDLTFNSGNSNAVSVDDVDAGPDGVKIDLSATSGTFTLSGTAGLSFSDGDGTADSTMTFTGSVVDVKAALNGLTYRGAQDYNGSDIASLTINDLGHNGSGGPHSDSDTIPITVNPVNDAPVADDETFTVAAGNNAVGNTPLSVGTSQAQPSKSISKGGPTDVLNGDTDVDGPGPLVVEGGTIPTADGGSVTIAANGDFTYFPAANPHGCDTSDSFDYTVSDQNTPTAGTGTGTVTIAISNCVWYVDSSVSGAGTGTGTDPFKTLSSLNVSATDSDVSGDTLMILDSSSYSGGLTLEDNETLRSKHAGLTVGGSTIVTAAGSSNPTITNSAGNALTLADSNTIQGIDLGSASAASLAGSSFTGTAVMDTTTSGSINNPVGKAVDLSSGDLNTVFSSISSGSTTGSSTEAIKLANVTGTFTGSGGTIQNATNADFDLSGGASADDAAVTYNGTISDSSGTVVSVSGQGGGTKVFGGTIGSGSVSLSANTGATINFVGGLGLSSGANNAFSATGGGTVNVTDSNSVGAPPDNTLATTTGTALHVANTTIGASDLNFKSIASNGAANGIVLTATGTSGGLTVAGTGTAGSGGTIQNSTGAGVSLTSVGGGVSLSRMSVTGGGDDGIGGSTDDGLTLDHVNVTSNGNANGESGLDFSDLTGTVNLTSSNVSNNFDNNVAITNASGTLNATVSGAGSAYSGASGGQGDGIFVEGTGTGAQNLTIQGTAADPIVFANNKDSQVQHTSDSANTTDSNVTIDHASMSEPANGGTALGGGITINHGGNSNVDATITNNNIQNSVIGAIAIDTSGSVADQQHAFIDATIQNNTIGTAGVAGSGSTQGNGIFVSSNGAGHVRTLITGNTVRQWTNRNGLELDVDDGPAQLDATVHSNTFTEPNSAFAGTTTRGFTFQLGAAQAGDSIHACLDVGDPSNASLKNQVFGTGESPQQDIRYLHEGPSSVVNLANFAGGNTSTDIIPWLQSRNNIGGTPSVGPASWVAPAGSSTTSVASCPQPAS